MTNDRWIDLSHPLVSGMPIYPGDPEYQARVVSQDTENGFLVHDVSLGLHSGTHIDGPSHALTNALTIEKLPIDRFVGEANVIRVRPIGRIIHTNDLDALYAELKAPTPRLLISTTHAKNWGKDTYFAASLEFENDFPDWAKARRLELIGADLPTFSFRGNSALLCHQALFQRGILLLENLTNLDKLASRVFLVACPLKFQGLEASPVRAIAKNNFE